MSNYKEVLDLKQQIESEWLEKEGIQGISIGEEVINNKYTGSFAIYMHIHSPMAVKTHSIPKALKNVKIFTIEEDTPVPQSDTAKYRPLVGGIQLKRGSKLGTLGCMAIDNKNGQVVALSNQHVMGDVGNNIGQPNLNSGNIIGKTVRTVRSEKVDAAIASIGEIGYNAEVVKIGAIKGTYNVTSEDILGGGYPIMKRGKTTELTHGKITQINYSGDFFEDLLYVVGNSGAFTKRGDSGSVYVNDDKKVVGLHWGGAKNHSYSLGFPIQNVMDQLKIDILTDSRSSTIRTSAKLTKNS